MAAMVLDAEKTLKVFQANEQLNDQWGYGRHATG
jgi:hypothetical protein